MNRSFETRTFITHDDVELSYRFYPATNKNGSQTQNHAMTAIEAPAVHTASTEQSSGAKGAILLFHRGHEHAGRMAHLVDELNLPDFDFFAWDARGHGLSPGERGYSPSIGTSVRDIQSFMLHITQQYQHQENDMFLIAQSVGAVLASTYVHDYAPKIRGMILASPAFKVKLYVPFARTGLKVMQKIKGNFFINSYVKSRFLTHDKTRQASYDNDPLISRAISSNILLGLYDTAERIVADAKAITIPTQLLVSSSDWVVHHKPQYEFYHHLGSPRKELHRLSGFYHDTLGEADRHLAIEKMRPFILEQFNTQEQSVDLKEAHLRGYTYEEKQLLEDPLDSFDLKKAYWRTIKIGLGLSKYCSKGIQLGYQTGFDSGSMLDFVYTNQPISKNTLGKFIDKQYLNSIGWQGIRQRKVNIEELMIRCINQLQKHQKPIKIIDIAAGHGRYVLDALAKIHVMHPNTQIEEVLLRDFSELNVKQGRELIKEHQLGHIAQFEQGDAFNTDSLKAIANSKTLGIVSGLYELFDDNTLISQSLEGMYHAIETGGYLIYTNQPWHPQLEFIARVLTSHRDGQPWVMRRRTQQEMDQLVEQAGFIKCEQRIDEFGIFTVSVARKR
ncbi:bifunctional alpha/beta hydrolase/class I SAM-dependent methyltransferase [Thorsellia anophelis]|uniref:Lysophospholipase, alpha-beta hydrolase superfamily n=1 Tax=Thorsellia anophelis DSM 18579 TaxID=1123402 RepID=A0A1H9ZE94_9GAMM|nr:bifunctional alpha/beta hydrolase/class I SAM-dependent methyltransferase [Thorsellia anophelis]SES79894.1 Lysophospholipase, alpha-beta hydrolase superfamily [Thorsellia anophelis DSM 18579]